MNKEELAALINGREYGNELTRVENKTAQDNNLVVVFGASDDLMEFEGAIYEELEAWEGATAYLDKDGLISEDDYKYLKRKGMLDSLNKIEAIWSPRDENGQVYSSWLMKTDIPHAPFDIMEDG